MVPDALGNLWMIAEGNLLVMTDEVLGLKKKWDINLYGRQGSRILNGSK